MPDDVILQYVKSIDERTARMESTMTTAMQIHQQNDTAKHDEIDTRLKSLETSRTAARAGMAALALGGGTGAAKLGLLAKITGLFGGGA